MNRATEMKREKKINKIFRVLGFILGGLVGVFIGYQLAIYSRTDIYDDISLLTFLLTLVVGALGSIIGFVLVASCRNN